MLGCSRTNQRHEIDGVVTLDGKPIEAGTIAFLPQAGTKSPTAGGNITQGRFAITSAAGPFAGSFRVEVAATQKTGRKIKDPRFEGTVDEVMSIIPAQYNRESRLSAEVTQDGPNHFEFALQTR
jgi:hypothetical protein